MRRARAPSTRSASADTLEPCDATLAPVAVFTYQRLRAEGLTRRDIERSLTSGALIRARPDAYMTTPVVPEVLTAVSAGGSLTCGAALRHHGIWTSTTDVHVRIDPDSRVHARPTRIHRLTGVSRDGVDDVETALSVSMRCMTIEETVCSLDSSLNLGRISQSSAERILSGRRGRTIVARSDGRSESGIETLARLRLRALGIRLRVQVPIAGIGRVDILVGDRLVIELDGDAWHSTAEQRETDRRRDSALVARGYLVIRAGYWRVVADWAGLEVEILAVVRRGEHRWRTVHPDAVHNVRSG